MVSVKWYWDGVKYPEVWGKHCSLHLTEGTSACKTVQEAGQGQHGGGQGPVQGLITSSFLLGIWDANPALSATTALSLCWGRVKPRVLPCWRRGVRGRRSGSISKGCGSVPTLMWMNYFSFSLCCAELGELPWETSFLQRFFFFITS